MPGETSRVTTTDASGASAVLSPVMARQRRGATTMLEVQVTDMGKLEAARALLEVQEGRLDAGADLVPKRRPHGASPRPSPWPWSRQEAEAYAAALAMWVARAVRVYDQAVTASQAQDLRR